MTTSEPGPEPEPDADPTARLASGAVDWLAGIGREVRSTERLHGGTIARTIRLTLDNDDTVVLKQRRGVPDGTWEAEVDGLAALRLPDTDPPVPEVPAVFTFGADFLLLEDFGHPVPDDEAFWELFGRRLAGLHLVHGSRHGWHRDNMLAAIDQRNPWTDDGWTFFAEQRLLRYLDVANVDSALTADDRIALERVAGRLRDIIPAQPPSLTHGDLWRSNVLAVTANRPAVCDPAVSYTWAEVDLSMLWCSGGVPEACFAAYEEVRPLDPGWRDRAPLLHVRENLSVLAHVGYDEATVTQIRAALAPYL